MKLGDTIFNGNQFKNVILNSTSYKRLILGVNLVWSYFSIAIKSFKTRISADGGTYEGESILEDRLQEITPSLFDSASLVITPNGVKTSKLYSIKPSDGTGDLSVVRATSATRVNENGLIEIPATNLVLRSEEFNDAYWFKANTVITPNQTLSPINTLTADLISESNTTNNLFYLYSLSPLISVQQGIWYTASVYVKKGIGITAPDIIQMTFNSNRFGSLQYANFNIVSGTITYSQNGNASIKALADGWFRISWTSFATSTGVDNFIPIIFCNNNPTSLRAPVYNGKNTSDIFIWGAQVEQGMTATEYIPTTSVIRTKFAGITQDGGSASNIPRIDYTTGSPAILVEPQSTNLLLISEEFNDVNWTKSELSISSNVTTSPNGTMNADKIIATNVLGSHFFRRATGLTLGTECTYSIYAKAAENKLIRVGTNAGAGVGATFDLLTGAITNMTATSAFAQNIGNGWYRCIVTGGAGSVLDVFLLSNSGLQSYIGNETDGIFIWGAQLEAGSNATSYIPTTTSTVTRNADVISKSGISNLIGQTEGTIFCEFISNDGKNINTTIFSVNNLTATEIIRLGYNSYPAPPSGGYLNLAIRSGNIIVVDINAGILIPIKGQNYKVCVTYSQTAQKIFVNGTLVATRTGSYTQPGEMNSTQLGSLASSFISNTSFNSALIIKNALTDQEAIQLTTL